MVLDSESSSDNVLRIFCFVPIACGVLLPFCVKLCM